MKKIRTKRLILRPFRDSDYDDLYEFLSQLREDEFEGYPGITYENGKTHLRERVGSPEFWAVELAGAGKVIGNIYCGSRDYGAKEFGCIINRRFRRSGYACEALSAAVNAAFEEGVHRVYACDPRNLASWKLLESVGFMREAHLRQNIFFHRDEHGAPIWKDTFIYALVELPRSPSAGPGKE